MALEPIRGRRAGIVPNSRRRVICVSNFLRQRMGRCRCGDDNDVGSIPKPAGPIDGLLVEHRLLFVVSTYLVRRPKENVIQHRAIIRSPMVRRRLQQPSNSGPAVHSLHRHLECFPQEVHAHEASGSPMAIQRYARRWR